MQEPTSGIDWAVVVPGIASFIAILISFIALHFTKRSSNAAVRSANSADESATTAENALAFAKEQSKETRNQFLTSLAEQAQATGNIDAGLQRVLLASVDGEENAVEARNLFAKMMTPAQIAEAQKMAREWKPTGKRKP